MSIRSERDEIFLRWIERPDSDDRDDVLHLINTVAKDEQSFEDQIEELQEELRDQEREIEQKDRTIKKLEDKIEVLELQLEE